MFVLDNNLTFFLNELGFSSNRFRASPGSNHCPFHARSVVLGKQNQGEKVPFQTTEIAGVHLFTPKLFTDSRGLFFESFKPDQVLSETGREFYVAQVNNSVSARGVVRGIHFKENPPGQAKFVSVHRGSIIDVVIDLRKGSPTFKKWQAFEINDQNRYSLLIENGIGHSFASLEDETLVSYLCDTVFQPELEHGINPLSAGIDWEGLTGLKFNELVVSEKDLEAPRLLEAGSLLFD